MIRLPSHRSPSRALIASALYAYSVKYDTLYYAEQVAKLKAKVHTERDAIAVLKAEWQLLTGPTACKRSPTSTSTCSRSTSDQLARLADLPNRPQRGDEIGRKLEALGLLEPTATPKDKQPGGARTPSTRTPAR